MFLKASFFKLATRLFFLTQGERGAGGNKWSTQTWDYFRKAELFFQNYFGMKFFVVICEQANVQNSFLNLSMKTEFILDLRFRSYRFFWQPPLESNFLWKFAFQPKWQENMYKDSKLVEKRCALCDICSITLTSLYNPNITIVPVTLIIRAYDLKYRSIMGCWKKWNKK